MFYVWKGYLMKYLSLAASVVAFVALTSSGFADSVTLDGTNFAANGGTFAINTGSQFEEYSGGLMDFSGNGIAWASQSNNTGSPGTILLLSSPPAGGYRDAGMVFFFNSPIARNQFVSAEF